MITELKENQIFVFGSNLAGKHVGGAAKQAVEMFGAVEGEGEGLFGQSYAFPTLTEDLKQLSRSSLKISVSIFYDYCRRNPQLEFLLTPVGTGIAGFSHDYMKSLFTNPPVNVVLPEEWK